MLGQEVKARSYTTIEEVLDDSWVRFCSLVGFRCYKEGSVGRVAVFTFYQICLTELLSTRVVESFLYSSRNYFYNRLYACAAPQTTVYFTTDRKWHSMVQEQVFFVQFVKIMASEPNNQWLKRRMGLVKNGQCGCKIRQNLPQTLQGNLSCESFLSNCPHLATY